MSGTLHPAAPNPPEDFERQTGNQARDLARAIARIGELDVTRTLPGRLVWYERPWPQVVSEPHKPICKSCDFELYSVDHTGLCFQCRAVERGKAYSAQVGTLPPLTPAKAEEETLTLLRSLTSPVDPTRQGGLEAWPRPVRVCFKCGLVISSGWVSFTNHVGEFCGPCWDPKRYPRVLDVDAALANGDSR